MQFHRERRHDVGKVGIRPVVAVAVVAIAMVVGFSASASGDADKGALIQVIHPIASSYTSQNTKGAMKEAKRLGLTNMHVTQSDADATKMVASINDAITKDAKAIILNPINSSAATPAIKRANREGICTIIAYSNIANTPLNKVAPGSKAYIGWDETVGGAAVADAMAKKMNGKGNVVIISGLAANLGTTLRINGARNRWKTKWPGMKVLGIQYSDYDASKARAIMQNFIQQFGSKINGVLSADDSTGVAEAQVIKNSALRGKVVLAGFGGQRQFVGLIKQGLAYATVPFTPVSDFETAVRLAWQCIQGNKTPVVFNEPRQPVLKPLASAGYVLTSENVNRFTPQW
jgi:ribose transport system substrate-binding protein